MNVASDPKVVERLSNALADRYRIDSEIGSGGMATVYLAQDLKHDRKVAVKVLRSDLAASLGVERFLQEVRVTANLTHPHILPLHDSGEADGFLFYVMPYIEGESLRERLIREHELPVSEAARLLRDVVDALAAAHKLGVVHRDIKPENVLISGRHGMVADFGVAKAVSEATGRHKLTTVGVALGTPSYMAPEQAAADETIDHRADIYAVGAMAYELLTGRPPFTGGTPQQILAAQVMETPQPVTELRASVPPALETLIMRCLEKKPADRWQSAEEMLPHLEAAATPSGGITPTDIQPVTRPSPLSRRPAQTWLSRAGVAAVAALALAVAYFVFFRGGPASTLPEDRVAVFPFENLTGDPELDDLGPAAAHLITDWLSVSDEVGAVATSTVLQALQLRGGSATPQEVAASLGAGTAVTGVLTSQGDTLEFRAQITRVENGEVLSSVEASGVTTRPMEAVDELRERVLGALAVSLNEVWSELVGRPPSYEALRAFMRGVEILTTRDWPGALPHLQRANALDSAFLSPLLWEMVVYGNMGQWARADSLVAILELRRNDLTPIQQFQLEYIIALLAGDNEGQLRAHRALAREDPSTYGYFQASSALRAGRPEEAMRALEGVNPDQPITTVWSRFWVAMANANHLTGRYREALEVARRGQALFPEYLPLRRLEIRALVAMDRLDEIDPLLDSVEVMEPEGGESPGTVFRQLSADLAREGHTGEARRLGERSLEWYLARDPEGYQQDRARALLLADRPDEALALLKPLIDEDPESLTLHGLYGIALARTGDSEGAEAEARWCEELNRPYLWGSNTYCRAAIYAHLNRLDEATRLLRQALQEGLVHSGLYADPNLKPLWNYEPYEQVIAPKG